MRRFGKKLCKQGSPYKKLQKSAGSAIVQNRLMPCWDKTKPSWDRQAAGLHTEFGVQAALRAPHRQIPQGASPGMNILPLLLYIPRAKFRLFLRFKGPASKWTGISPRGRLQPPPCPKTRSGALRYTLPCSDTPYSAATRPCRTSPHITARQTYPDVARPPTVLHPTPFKRPSPSTFQPTFRSPRSLCAPPRPLAQLIHGRAKPLPRFPCCQ